MEWLIDFLQIFVAAISIAWKAIRWLMPKELPEVLAFEEQFEQPSEQPPPSESRTIHDDQELATDPYDGAKYVSSVPIFFSKPECVSVMLAYPPLK